MRPRYFVEFQEYGKNCLEHGDGGVEAAVAQFGEAMAGEYAEAVARAIDMLKRRFAAPDGESYRMDGPVAVAQFESDEDGGDEVREQRILRQRGAAAIIDQFLGGL